MWMWSLESLKFAGPAGWKPRGGLMLPSGSAWVMAVGGRSEICSQFSNRLKTQGWADGAFQIQSILEAEFCLPQGPHTGQVILRFFFSNHFFFFFSLLSMGILRLWLERCNFFQGLFVCVCFVMCLETLVPNGEPLINSQLMLYPHLSCSTILHLRSGHQF